MKRKISNEPDKKKRPRTGAVCSLEKLANGKSRLYFDDVINDTSAMTNSWQQQQPFIQKDYDAATLENLNLSRNELAEIGLALLNRLLARQHKRTDRKKLIADIHLAFKEAEFPTHLGLIASESIHVWETDPEVLEELTKRHDFHGAWWDIPTSHLDRDSFGLRYLDATGIAFYLPSFMSLALKKPRSRYINILVDAFDPGEDDKHLEIFTNRFSKISGNRKEVCIRFMHYMKEVLMLTSHTYITEVERINRALNHTFWKIKPQTIKNEKPQGL